MKITPITSHPRFPGKVPEQPAEPVSRQSTYLVVVGRSPNPQILVVTASGCTDFDGMRDAMIDRGDRSNRLVSCPSKPPRESKERAIGRARLISRLTDMPLVTVCPDCGNSMTSACVPRCGAYGRSNDER